MRLSFSGSGHMQEMDWETIAAGLLHDTVEDTEIVTFERIEDQFGPAVRRIVEGETKAGFHATVYVYTCHWLTLSASWFRI